MLILTRKHGEQIDIGQDVVITVVEINSDRVRIGISAPKDVVVHRREITELLRIKKEYPDE